MWGSCGPRRPLPNLGEAIAAAGEGSLAQKPRWPSGGGSRLRARLGAWLFSFGFLFETWTILCLTGRAVTRGVEIVSITALTPSLMPLLTRSRPLWSIKGASCTHTNCFASSLYPSIVFFLSFPLNPAYWFPHVMAFLLENFGRLPRVPALFSLPLFFIKTSLITVSPQISIELISSAALNHLMLGRLLFRQILLHRFI